MQSKCAITGQHEEGGKRVDITKARREDDVTIMMVSHFEKGILSSVL